MKLKLRPVFAGTYAVLVMWLLIECWVGLGLPFLPGLGLPVCALWVLICFSAYSWLPSFSLSLLRLRKTILEEEEWLHPLMHELALRSGMDRLPELLIWEKPEMGAYAIGRRTVILTRGLLVTLSEPEIKAVLAHEYGHLRDRDTLAETVFALADWLPRQLIGTGKRVLGRPGKGRVNVFFPLAVVLIFLMYYTGQMAATVFVILSLLAFFALRQIIKVCWCLLSQRYEFRQDGYAQSLGCGRHLKSALLKIDSLHSEGLVNRITQLWGSHPMLYARIRRLEWLEGLRPTP